MVAEARYAPVMRSAWGLRWVPDGFTYDDANRHVRAHDLGPCTYVCRPD